MAMQKFRADKRRETRENGAIEWFADWMGGPTLSKVDSCPCEDGKARTVYVTGQPCTWFSVPAATRVCGKYVSGFVTYDDAGPKFVAFKGGKTAGRMPARDAA